MKKVLSAIAILSLVGAVASAQSLGLKGVGGGFGYTSVSIDPESYGGFVISAHANLGELTNNLEFVPELQYLSASKTITGTDVSVTDFAINANVQYKFPGGGQITPYVGGGLGLNFFSWDIGGFIGSSSYTRLGVNLLGGAAYQVNPSLSVYLEPRYVLASDFNHFNIKLGVTYALK